jgi:UPF0755 protein
MRSKRGHKAPRLIAAATVVTIAGAAWLAWGALRRPYRGFETGGTFIEVARGTSTRALATQLADAGVVPSAWHFLAARALHPRTRLQAGEYRFERAASPLTVFHRIARGDVFFYDVTVPEGSNMFDIAALLEHTGAVRADDFMAVAGNPELIRDIDPRAPSLEGYLFPSTYRLTHRVTAQQICRLLTGEFRKQWRLLGAAPSKIHDAVTLASLVEKETGTPAERPVVASVFRNRLAKGMTLDCDPTTIYAAMLDKRFRGTIHRSDLLSQNAYNTYRHPGLPPGPIANPGVASLKASLAPADTDYLYFVARVDGPGHRFARTLEEHNRNVKEYRRGHAGKGAESTAAQGVSRARAAHSRRSG